MSVSLCARLNVAKGRGGLVTALVTAMLLASSAQAGPVEAAFDTGFYYRLTTQFQGDGKSLDIVNEGENSKQPILLATGNYSGQLWKLTPAGDGYYRLTTQFQGEGKSLDIVNEGENSHQPILLATGDFTGQRWKLTPAGNGYYRLTTQFQGEGKSLDILNEGKNSKQPILAATGNHPGQLWKVTRTKVAVEAAFDAGFYYRLTTQFQGDGKSLDIVNEGENSKQPILAATGNHPGQLWKLTPAGKGFYRLTTQFQGDGKSLDIVNEGKNSKQPVLAATGPFSGQLWKLTRTKVAVKSATAP